MDYKEKLQDERWKSRRREIVYRDKHRCKICGSDSTLLNVHHLYYTKGAEPWEYPDGALVTLCPRCHDWVHKCGVELEVRRSKISDSWICGIRNEEDSDIHAGVVMASEEMDLIYMVADKPFFEMSPVWASDGMTQLHPSEYPVSKNVETLVSLSPSSGELCFNEYRLALDGCFDTCSRFATDDEKQLLIDAIKNYMK